MFLSCLGSSGKGGETSGEGNIMILTVLLTALAVLAAV